MLAKGELKAKVAFEVTGASDAAVKAVEAAGGTVTLAPMARRVAKAGNEGDSKASKNKAAKSKPKAETKDEDS